MSSILEVMFFSLIGGVFSLVGGLILLSRAKKSTKIADYATPFAAGALLAAAFIDLIPEALHDGEPESVLRFTLAGILGFFLLERFLRWFHHHRNEDGHDHGSNASLIVIGDTIHNFIDGIAIAAGFLVSPSTGIVVTLAVAAHEIPHEIGDFGLLLKKGMDRKKIILVNIVSALATSVSAVLFFQLGQSIEVPLDSILALVAGFFIYIALSDIIPTIHAQESKNFASIQTALLILGVLVVGITTTQLHAVIEQGEAHEDEGSSHIHGDEEDGKEDESHSDEKEEGHDNDGDSHDEDDDESHEVE